MNATHPISPEREAKWQRHAIVLLWVCIALLFAVSAALLIGRAHGLFHSSPDRLPPSPAWPADS